MERGNSPENVIYQIFKQLEKYLHILEIMVLYLL